MVTPHADLRLAFYGDDFTGSTDALDVLAFAGLRCAQFLRVPDQETLRALGPFDAVGIAGASRGMSPDEMGFADLPVDAAALVANDGWQHSLAALAEHAITALRERRSVVLHTARPARLARHRDARHSGGARRLPPPRPARWRQAARPAPGRACRYRAERRADGPA